MPLQLSIEMAYTEVRFNSSSVIGRYSLPDVICGKYLPSKPLNAGRFLVAAANTRIEPKATTIATIRFVSN
jgi:hypothetical protein